MKQDAGGSEEVIRLAQNEARGKRGEEFQFSLRRTRENLKLVAAFPAQVGVRQKSFLVLCQGDQKVAKLN